MQNALIYNLTLKIGKHISGQWLQEMETQIIPDCSNESSLISTQINRILIEDNEDDTFAIQFIFPSYAIFEEVGKDMFKKMVLMIDKNFKGKYVYFGTMMEVMHYSNYTV